jgi:hypothetical protein
MLLDSQVCAIPDDPAFLQHLVSSYEALSEVHMYLLNNIMTLANVVQPDSHQRMFLSRSSGPWRGTSSVMS